MNLESQHIAVLMGGLSSEREVSLVSGKACAEALERLGARVSRVDAGRDLAQVLAGLKPDAVFNALHGEWGEDGCVQGILETLAIPYTHSGVLASALAMDKAKAKAVLAAAGVAVPGGGLFDRFEVAAGHVIPPPYVVKPNAEGSSVGVFLVFEGANSPPQEVIAETWTFGEQVMVEPYIAGRELAVGVREGRAMTATEIVPSTGFYDFEAKYGEGGSSHVVPAKIPPHAFEKALKLSELAHAALGCWGVSRSDLRYDDVKDEMVLLEVNTQPGMTPTSLVPEQAAHLGMGFDQLVAWIVEDAYARCPAGEGARGAPPAKKAPPARRTSAPANGRIAGKLRAADGALPSHIALWAAGGVLVLALGVVLATGHRAQRIAVGAERGVAIRMAGYGFKVSKVQIAGASTMAQPDIAAAAAYVQSQPILSLDLPGLQHQMEAVGWVKSAQIIRLLPNTVLIKIVERDRMAVWQHDGQTFVVDKQGNVAPDANPALFPDLPLIVGQGAPQSAQTILDTLASHPDLRGQVEALVRVDDRRWDLHLKSGALIQLPAENPDAALLRLDQMQARDQVLSLALDRIDLRDPDQTAVRLKSDAATPPAATPAQGPA